MQIIMQNRASYKSKWKNILGDLKFCVLGVELRLCKVLEVNSGKWKILFCIGRSSNHLLPSKKVQLSTKS